MSEIISLHVGQAGIQIGASCWEVYCLEHGIQFDGKMTNEGVDKIGKEDRFAGFNKFFQESYNGKYIPRAIFVDLEPTIIDKVRTGAYGQMLQSTQLISGNRSPAVTFAQGHYSPDVKDIGDICIDRIRKLVEKCSNVEGFLVFSAVGGGTGSGFASLLLEQLSIDYEWKPIFGISVYPSQNSSTPDVDTCNSLLYTQSILKYADADLLLDNAAIFDICRRFLYIEQPTYSNLNTLCSQVVSSLTARLRFGRSEASVNNSMTELRSTLVPYPWTPFLISSYTPVVSAKKPSNELQTVAELTRGVFENSYTMANCNAHRGRYLGISLVFRGDCEKNEVDTAVSFTKKKTIQFVDWCPNPTCDVIKELPTAVLGGELAEAKRTLCMVSNSTSVTEVFSRITHKFDMMHARRDIVQRFVDEGMEEGMLFEAREDLIALEKDYEEAGDVFFQ